MLLLVFFGIAIFLAAFLWHFSPEGFVIHAARSSEVWIRTRRFPLAALYHDESGKRLDLSDRLIGIVKGDSCLSYGIRDGDIVVAKRIKFDDSNAVPSEFVSEGDLVIINSETEKDKHPLRFRKVLSFDEGLVNFVEDRKGALKSKPFSDIVAKVELVSS